MKWLAFTIVFTINNLGYSQCISNQLENAQTYLNKACGSISHQGILTTGTSLYGSCGEISFTPPLLEDDIGTSTNEDQDKTKEIKIFPNPFNNRINISLPFRSNFDLRLYNSFGVKVKYWSIKNDKSLELDLSDIYSGVFILEIIDFSQNVYLKKQIIKI